jgi:carbon-monoxide dehydrogenase medium subunit
MIRHVQGGFVMHIPDVELHRAASLEEAASLMAHHAPDARLLAGGTDLLVDLKTGRVAVRHVVSLDRIEALRGISKTDDGLRIGALATLTELGEAPDVHGGFAPLLDAVTRMAGRQIRNMATVGGNVACGVPCADLPPILIAMRASVRLWSPGGARDVPIEKFHTGPRETVRRDDEVLTEVRVPDQGEGFGAAYARFAQRDGNAIAVAGVAASLMLDERGDVAEARVALNAVAPTPKMVAAAGQALVGRTPDEAAFREAARLAREAAEPISDSRGSADFRRDLVEVLARRALERAAGRATGGAS